MNNNALKIKDINIIEDYDYDKNNSNFNLNKKVKDQNLNRNCIKMIDYFLF